MISKQVDKKIFLLDAMALIYRAHFALNKNPRVNSKGLNTSAILGFANTLYDLLKNEKPTHIGVAFDMQAPTVRHIEFSDYKANREAMPEDLSIAIPYIKRLIAAFNIPMLGIEGYEADDLIGTLAKKAEQQGFITYMMTPDKDFGQLVSENIFMFKPAKFGNEAEVWGINEVCNRFGLTNQMQVTDYLGLAGDASDNIPGIPGVGEVTAKKLIAEYGSIENLIANVENIKNQKLKEKIVNFAEQALFSKKLATIILDAPVEFDVDKLKIQDIKVDELRELLDELEFRTFAKRVFTDLSLKTASPETPQMNLFGEDAFPIEEKLIKNTVKNTNHEYFIIDNEEKIDNLVNKLMSSAEVCFDTETTGLDVINAGLVGISFSVKAHEAYYIPVPDNFEKAKTIVNKFIPVFENEKILKIGQNIKFDIGILKKYGVILKGNLFDTMIAHYLLEPDQRHNMDFLAETYLNYSPVAIESLIGKKGKDQLSMRWVNTEVIAEYAAEDADITFQLFEIFSKQLKENNLYQLFNDVEIPLIEVLSDMEMNGINLDKQALKDFSIQLSGEISLLENQIYEHAGEKFNIASPQQLGKILFEKLNIVEKAKLTKTKQYSTGEEILQKIVDKHPIIPLILEYRTLSKLKSTYVDALPEMINPTTKRVHTSFNQAVASTGRLSSNNPNLQNIPIKTEKGREIRKAFIARNEEYELLSADYSQIELRIIAALSEDKNMIDAFVNNHDIHTATAAKVFNISMDDVSKEQRRYAKSVNFGIIYGMSAFGLSEQLSISRKDAAAMIEQYFKEYANIKQYMHKTVEFAKQHGYVETILGRKRFVKDIQSTNAIVRGYAERNAINAPIQGSAADMIKIAMINIYRELKAKNLQSKMILQVHDELIFDVHISEKEIVKEIVINEMKNAVKIAVPIDVDARFGKNWLEAH